MLTIHEGPRKLFVVLGKISLLIAIIIINDKMMSLKMFPKLNHDNMILLLCVLLPMGMAASFQRIIKISSKSIVLQYAVFIPFITKRFDDLEIFKGITLKTEDTSYNVGELRHTSSIGHSDGIDIYKIGLIWKDHKRKDLFHIKKFFNENEAKRKLEQIAKISGLPIK